MDEPGLGRSCLLLCSAPATQPHTGSLFPSALRAKEADHELAVPSDLFPSLLGEHTDPQSILTSALLLHCLAASPKGQSKIPPRMEKWVFGNPHRLLQGLVWGRQCGRAALRHNQDRREVAGGTGDPSGLHRTGTFPKPLACYGSRA